MTISLPEALKAFVDEQVSQRGYGTNSEYVHELIHKEQEREPRSCSCVLCCWTASNPALA